VSGQRRFVILAARFALVLILVVALVITGLLRPTLRPWISGVSGVTAVVAILSVLVTVAPDLLVRRDTRLSRAGRLRDREFRLADRIKARGDARASMLQSISTLGLIIGLVFTVVQITATQRSSQQQLRLTQQQLVLAEGQQVDDRFTRAIQNIGSSDTSVRLGGIYALGNIAADTHYRERALAVLAIFVSRHADRTSQRVSDAIATSQRQPDVYAALAAGCAVGGGPPFSDLLSLADRSATRARLDNCQLTGVDMREPTCHAHNCHTPISTMLTWPAPR